MQRRLPWLVAAGALVVYGLTLPDGVTATGLPTLARVLGWDWQPMFLTPLLAVLTYPVRWLPAGGQMLALNLFAAVCSALALALLARTVAILPQDRTREQRGLEQSEYSFLSIRAAWVPPVLAALVCGLQLSFWENAVVATGESLDLLIVAYCVRCLMEYRIELRDSWLYRMAPVYGLGIVNNYAMIAFLPLFVGAMLWTRGRDFFQRRFLLRMLGLGTAGLALYLVLPAVNSLAGLTDYSFLEILRTHLGAQRNTLWEFPRFLLVIIVFTSIVPVVFIGIRWPAQYGDISAAGNLLANLMMHVVHALFLAACLWVMFDPTFSPRALGARYGQPWAFLPFYYLAALTVGYCTGYFLLVFGPAPPKSWQRPSPLRKAGKLAVVAAVWAVLIAAPSALVYRNLPALKGILAPHLELYGTTAARQLPSEGALVLSDDSYRLFAVQSALRRSGRETRHVLIHTTALSKPAYHRYLKRHYPQRWPKLPAAPPPPARELSSLTLLQFLLDLHQTIPIYYLHPSFGYYFESFHVRPRQLVFEVTANPTNQVSPPPLTRAELDSNDRFWQHYRRELAPLLDEMARGSTRDKRPVPFVANLAGSYYSRHLNHLGVECQRAGQLAKAGEYFDLALQFFTNNPAAYLNRLYNRQLQAGRHNTILPNPEFEERLVPYRGNIELVLNMNGPIDEPNMCFLLSQVFANGKNFRQSVQLLERALALDSSSYPAATALVLSYSRINQPDRALREISRLRTSPALSGQVATNPLPFLLAEALAHAAKKDLPRAFSILAAAQKDHPLQVGPFATEVQIHIARNDLTNALDALTRQVAIQSNNVAALIDCGVVKMNLASHGPRAAIADFNRALALAPDSSVALRNRALAHARQKDWDAALKDYQAVMALLPKTPYWVHYGLGEVFAAKTNAAKAIEHYKKYLQLAPQGQTDIPVVKKRLETLKRGTF
ncbi:MAG: DUF2723 domain-containing protein [Verrucomicrobia bacterium]|nr:DUF2723 domain-containing protein [Verrucomicrobiota bacterium]